MSNDFNVIEEGKETPDKKKMKIMIIKNDSESKKMLEDSIIELKKWPVRLFWILIIIFSVISIIGLIIDRNIFTNTTAIIFLIIAGALFVLDFLKKGIITRYINLISRIKKIVREREENQKREIEKIKSAEQQLEISYDHKVEELEQAHSMRTQELESAYNEKTLILEQDFSRKSVELSNLDKKRAISSKMTLFLRFSQIIPTLSSFSEIISIENIDPNNLQDIFLKISEKSGKELPVVEALYQIFESGTMRRVTWEGLKSKEIYRRQFIDSLFQTKKLSAEARDIDPRIFDKLLEQLLDVASFLEEINQNIEILIKISREIQIFEKFCEEEECTFESFALWNDLYDVQKQLIPFKSNLLILFLNIIENRLHPVDEPTFELVIAKLISFVYVSRIYPEKKKEICEEFSKSDEFTAILWDYSNNKNHFKKLGNYINENEKKFSLIIEKLVKTNLFPFYKKKVSEGIIYENNQELIGAYVDARSREADIEFLYGTLLTEGHEFTLLNALKEFFALHLDFVTFLQGLILNKGIKLYLVTFRSKEGSLSKIIDSIIHLDAFGSENHKYDSTEYYNLWRYTDSARIGILAKDVTFADFENRLSTEIRDKIDEKIALLIGEINTLNNFSEVVKAAPEFIEILKGLINQYVEGTVEKIGIFEYLKSDDTTVQAVMDEIRKIFEESKIPSKYQVLLHRLDYNPESIYMFGTRLLVRDPIKMVKLAFTESISRFQDIIALLAYGNEQSDVTLKEIIFQFIDSLTLYNILISSKIFEAYDIDVIESHKKILDSSLNKILSGYHTPTATYSEFCLQIAKDLGFDVIENKMESLDELSIKIDQNLLANVQIRDEIVSIIQKIIIDPLQEEQLNLLSKYFIKQSVCIAHVLYHEIIYVPPPSDIPIFREEIEMLKEYVPFFDSDLDITDDQKLVIKQIKENCNHPKLEECLQCKKPINEKCWNFIISDLAGVPVNIHYSEEVADVVGNKLGQNFYFIVKSKEINNFPNGGDKLLRQCISCFEIKDAIVFYLNPHRTAPHILQKIKKIASENQNKPKFIPLHEFTIVRLYASWLKKILKVKKS